jgi:pheromone a factor receptor
MADPTTPTSYPTLPNSILLPFFASTAIVSNWVPFIALYRVKNLSACTMIVVNILLNFYTFINAILWPNDNISSWWNGHGLCDVEGVTRSVCTTLIATSTACLTRSLAQAVDADNPRLFETPSQRRRRQFGECLFIFGIPFFELVTHYVYQASRYAIVTIYGCADVIDYSWPTLVFLLIWPTFFSLLNCYYGGKPTSYPSIPSSANNTQFLFHFAYESIADDSPAPSRATVPVLTLESF